MFGCRLLANGFGCRLLDVRWLCRALLLSFVIFYVQATTQGSADVCIPEAGLGSPYVTSEWKESRPSTGCGSREWTAKGQEVHVVSWIPDEAVENSESPTVSLTIRPRLPRSSHAGNLVLVLHSPSPVLWKMAQERIAQSVRIMVLISPGSVVMSAGTNQPVLKQLNATSLPRLLSWIRDKRFKAITSFSRVQGANYLTLHVGIESSSPGRCNLESHQESPSMVAVNLIPVPSHFGCFVQESYKKNNILVYVLELISWAGDNQDVELHLFPGDGATSSANVNLVFVLTSPSPIRWILRVPFSIQGTVLLVSDQVVSVQNAPEQLRVEAQLADMPSGVQSQELLNWVQKHYGPVISFISTSNANLFKITLPNTIKEPEISQMQGDSSVTAPELGPHSLSNIRPNQGFPYHFHPGNQSSQLVNASILGWPKNPTLVALKSTYSAARVAERLPRTSSKSNLTRLLAVHMSWQCLEKTVVITFQKDGVQSALRTPEGTLMLTLRNRNCSATLNATHYILSYPLTSCGSQRKEKSNTNAYTNQVFFWLQQQQDSSEKINSLEEEEIPMEDEEDGEESGGAADSHGQPLLLHHMNFQGNCNTSLQYPNNNIEDGGESNSFRLDLFSGRDFSVPITGKGYPLEVIEHGFIYVEATMRTKSQLCASVEDCWLADTSDSQSVTSKKNILIRNSCPTDLSVQFLNSSALVPCRRRFSFQLNGDFMEKNLYLHCRLVACIQETVGVVQESQVLRKCADPEDFCISQSLRPFLDAPHYKHSSIQVRGPFRMVSKLRACKDKGSSSSNRGQKNLPAASVAASQAGQPTVVMVGLPTEAVVGVAIASFLIGAGLTALLWFIHHRTDPTRVRHPSGNRPERGPLHPQARPLNPHYHSGYDLSGHSGSSTPSSQVPMTVQSGT